VRFCAADGAPEGYQKAEGCEHALNAYCNQDDVCKICPKTKKYARYDFAAHEAAIAKWRCYCEYTLSEDREQWVNKPTKGNKDYLHYCTRHPQLEKRLQMCKDGTITKDGDEVKEL